MKNTDIEAIIRTKKFEELTSTEIDLVKDLTANEEEFMQMKHFLLSMASISQTTSINPSVKGNLDAVFNAKFQLPQTEKVYTNAVPKLIPFYNTLWFRAAAIFIIGLGVATPLLMNTSALEEKNATVAKMEQATKEESTTVKKVASDEQATPNKSSVKNNAETTNATVSNHMDQNSATVALSSPGTSASSTINTTTTTRARKVDVLDGLPMYKRKNKTGAFVYSNANMNGMVATSVTTASAGTLTVDMKDYELSKQPETTDQMLDIIQAVY